MILGVIIFSDGRRIYWKIDWFVRGFANSVGSKSDKWIAKKNYKKEHQTQFVKCHQLIHFFSYLFYIVLKCTLATLLFASFLWFISILILIMLWEWMISMKIWIMLWAQRCLNTTWTKHRQSTPFHIQITEITQTCKRKIYRMSPDPGGCVFLNIFCILTPRSLKII